MIARRPATLLTAAILLALYVLASLLVDSSRVPAGQIAHYLLHPSIFNVSYNTNVLRIQRTIMGVLVGAVLMVASAVMQAVTHNPLAEPGLFGANAGALLGIVPGIAALGVFPISGQLALAVEGVLVATTLVQVIGMVGVSSSPPMRLVLIDVTLSAFAGAVIQGVMLTMPSLSCTFIDWEVGSLTRTGIPLLPMTTLVMVGTGMAILLIGTLDNTAPNDDVTAVLGTWVTLAWSLSLVVATALCTTATTVADPIGFVGLMAPLMTPWLVGPHRGWVVTLCTLDGPVVALTAGVLGRVLVRPGGMQVGLLTVFVGSPVLLLTILRIRDRAL